MATKKTYKNEGKSMPKDWITNEEWLLLKRCASFFADSLKRRHAFRLQKMDHEDLTFQILANSLKHWYKYDEKKMIKKTDKSKKVNYIRNWMNHEKNQICGFDLCKVSRQNLFELNYVNTDSLYVETSVSNEEDFSDEIIHKEKMVKKILNGDIDDE